MTKKEILVYARGKIWTFNKDHYGVTHAGKEVFAEYSSDWLKSGLPEILDPDLQCLDAFYPPG
jgi:hypothetical protein